MKTSEVDCHGTGSNCTQHMRHTRLVKQERTFWLLQHSPYTCTHRTMTQHIRGPLKDALNDSDPQIVL